MDDAFDVSKKNIVPIIVVNENGILEIAIKYRPSRTWKTFYIITIIISINLHVVIRIETNQKRQSESMRGEPMSNESSVI